MSEKTLYRTRDDRMLGGVCAGIAEYFEIDPTVVRLLAVLAALLSAGGAIIAYLVMWVAVPEQPGVPREEGYVMSQDQPSAQPAELAEQPVAPAAPVPTPTPYVAPPVPSQPPRPPSERSRGSIWVGLVLVFVGVVLLVQMFVPWVRLWQFWPVVLIIWGVVLVFRRRGGE